LFDNEFKKQDKSGQGVIQKNNVTDFVKAFIGLGDSNEAKTEVIGVVNTKCSDICKSNGKAEIEFLTLSKNKKPIG